MTTTHDQLTAALQELVTAAWKATHDEATVHGHQEHDDRLARALTAGRELVLAQVRVEHDDTVTLAGKRLGRVVDLLDGDWTAIYQSGGKSHHHNKAAAVKAVVRAST